MAISISNILSEAGDGTGSLAELLSRDPEKYTTEDDDRIIEELRKMRARWEAGEKVKKVGGKKLVSETTEVIDGL